MSVQSSGTKTKNFAEYGLDNKSTDPIDVLSFNQWTIDGARTS